MSVFGCCTTCSDVLEPFSGLAMCCRLDTVVTRVNELEEVTNVLQANVRSHDQQLQRSGKLEQAMEDLSNQINASGRNTAELWSALDGYGIPKLNDSIQQVQSRLSSYAKSLESTAARCDDLAKDVDILHQRLQEEQQMQTAQLQTLQHKVSRHQTTKCLL